MAKVTFSSDSKVVAELDAIDASWLDELSAIRAQQQRLEGYCQKAEALKPTVTDSVWRKVIDEYDARSRQLDERAVPLVRRGHEALGRAAALTARIAAARDEALLQKDELEFRHAVGEVDDALLRTSLTGPLDANQRCDADLAAVERQQARFGAVIGDDPPPEVDVDSSTVDPSTEDSTVPMSEAARRAAISGPPPPPAPAPSSRGTAAPADARTFVLSPAALLVTVGNERTEHVLSALTQLGRADDNQIQLALAGVSRRHALITAGADGFVLRDLKSQSGTFLNGVRISEQALADGDCIAIAEAQIVFRMPWPEEAG